MAYDASDVVNADAIATSLGVSADDVLRWQQRGLLGGADVAKEEALELCWTERPSDTQRM